MLSGYAYSRLPQEKVTQPILLPVQMRQRVRERAVAEHPAAAVEEWLRAGQRLTAEEAAAIAFDNAPLDGLFREPGAIVSDSLPSAR